MQQVYLGGEGGGALTKREELLFLVVLALPKASKIGLACKICCSRVPDPDLPATVARYWITFFVFSVFPAPDSPLFTKTSAKKQEKEGGEDIRNQKGLVLAIVEHGTVGSVRNSEDVGSHFVPPLSGVHCNDLRSVNGEPLVGVHGDQEKARVGLIGCKKRRGRHGKEE